MLLEYYRQGSILWVSIFYGAKLQEKSVDLFGSHELGHALVGPSYPCMVATKRINNVVILIFL